MSLRLATIACIALATIRLSAQTSASVVVPNFVKAGEIVTIKGHISPRPNFDGQIQWTLKDDHGFSVQSGVTLVGDEFTIVYQVPYAAQSSVWALSKLDFYDGVSARPLTFEQKSFRVIANEGLVYPRSANVDLIPSQVQLLRREALQIQTQIQDFKIEVQNSSKPSISKIVKQALENEITQTEKTEYEYRNLNGASRNDTSGVFFADIRISYRLALDSLSNKPSVKTAAFSLDVSTEFTAGVQSTLRAMEHNELAYETAAGAESLNFDLEVRSTPPGAKISYGRRGDPTFQAAQDDTDTTIKSLTLAIWIVRVEAPGYEPQQKEHNAINEPYHVLNFTLRPKHIKR